MDFNTGKDGALIKANGNCSTHSGIQRGKNEYLGINKNGSEVVYHVMGFPVILKINSLGYPSGVTSTFKTFKIQSL